ncbi:MAG: hypothetical protein KatS3mg102_1536 [Planctomycetota bacterium]|nr:MAG: hypothetical protein KatS3mg102_1536 [Planctomycetota bacterium]
MGLFGLPSLGDIAESIVDNLTGIELLGDIAGAVTNVVTMNPLGLVEDVIDIGQNVVSAGAALGRGLVQTASNTLSSFLHGPGASKPPSMCHPPVGPGSGYCPGGQWPPIPPGMNINDPYVQGYLSGYQDGAGSFGLESPFGGFNFSGMSLEEKIAYLLAKLMERAERKLEEKTEQLAQAAEGKGGGVLDNLLGNKPVSENVALQELQQAQNKVNQLNTIWTNITQAQHQAHMAVAQNLRG